MRDLTAVKAALAQHEIELPSWAFGNTGTRFKVFGQPGVPRTPWEKAEDAAQVHRFTGVAPSMAVHIPWDKVDDYTALARHATDLGIKIGTVNANVFQDDDYKLGSVCNPDPRVRKKAVAHLLECVDIMDATGSRDLKLWFADGTNYPGQDDIGARQDRLAESLATVYSRLAETQRMLLEYKLFEPSFYSTDVPDWGTSLLHCMALGPRAEVVVDTGHHAPGTNIEFIVAMLLRAGRLGGFDFNSRFYADDDLMVGAADPFQLFRIMHEVIRADALEPTAGTAFMLDQCHNIEPKIPAQIRSVMNVQEATANPFGPVIAEYQPLPAEQRRARAAALAPVIRGLVSTDRPQVGHYTDTEVVLDFLSRAEHPRLAALGTSCPDHFLRTKVRPMVLDLPPDAPLEDVVTRLGELHEAYRAGYAAYYQRYAGPDSPPMRGADPAIVLVPGVGMFSYGAGKQTARVAGEFYVNAINVMRGAEALSTYSPIDESREVQDRVLGPGGSQARPAA